MWGAGVAGGMRFRAPYKLQIVKPLEGSLTLHTWAQLAKPNMSGKYVYLSNKSGSKDHNIRYGLFRAKSVKTVA